MQLQISLLAVFLCLQSFVQAAVVPVYWNVLYNQDNPSDGNYPDSVIQQNIAVANSFFGRLGLSFQIVGIQRLPVPSAAVHSFDTVSSFRSRLQRPGPKTLNVYTIGNDPRLRTRFLATAPDDYQQDPANDGIILDYNFLPGGRNIGYNTGKQLVSAIGFWAGLVPTYTNGCNAPGDSIADTAPEAGTAFGCPIGRDTCPQQPGADPIHNMMASTHDHCRTEFTSGQYSRIAQQLAQCRGINLN